MKTKNEDRKRTLRFYRTQAKACKLLLEKEPELSVEAKEWLQVYHNYFTECHKSILKRLPIYCICPTGCAMMEISAPPCPARLLFSTAKIPPGAGRLPRSR